MTAEQVIALAPDDSSAKAGRGLATISKWQSVGCDEKAIWGECKGSGKNPYQVIINISGPAFKCSCPSRKFPCKHGLGLFLLYASRQIKQSTPPAFCNEWLAKRAQTEERRKEKSEEDLTSEDLAKREKAKAKRISERETKVSNGLQELELWLKDLVRQGLANVQSRPTEYWEKMARRLIDAQAPNVARLVQEMSSVVYRKGENGDNWAENLLERIGKIYLICESYKRIAELPEPLQADVRTAVGLSVKEDELENLEIIEDSWEIHGIRIFEEDKLRVQRVWLYSEQNNRAALILNFAFQNQPLDVSFVTGTKVKGKLAFYPSNHPQRAFFNSREETQPLTRPSGYNNFVEFLQAYSTALSKNIWLETFPAMLKNVVPVQREKSWFLRDELGKLLPLDSSFTKTWKLFAISGNGLVPVFAEWNGETLLPLTAWTKNELIQF